MVRLAIFASGGGSNAQKIIDYFDEHQYIKVGLILTNKKNAGVVNIAKLFSIPIEIAEKSDFDDTEKVIGLLNNYRIDYIILAGFLLLIPDSLIKAFPEKILNIHPSLLPKYGGKGMYGQYVHEKVKEMQEAETGMTIHLVNEKYDEGKIVFQAKCLITPEMTAKDIGKYVLELEHKHYPKVIENYISQKTI